MKDIQDWAAVQRCYKINKSIRATAKQLGMSRNTVRKLLKMKDEPTYNRKIYPSKVDDYKELIITWRCEPYLFNGTRIYRELRNRGYTASIAPIYRFLKKIDEEIDVLGINKKATTRIETPLGDQAQFDWSHYNIMINGKYRTVYCFAMILAASRKKAILFSLKADATAIYDAIQELFEELGGVTLELLIDNPKALVIENNPKNEYEIVYNPHALMLAKHLGTELNACPCYWPRKKGKIENSFNYIEEQFVKGNHFASMDELNHRAKLFVDEWCNEIHTTTKRIPNQHYLLEELATLQPLPCTHYYHKEFDTRLISNDCMISVKGNKYSVPAKYACRKVLFRLVYGFRIEVYDKNKNLIVSFEASDKKHDIIRRDEHYEDIVPKVATSIPQIRRDFTSMFSNGYRYLEAASKQFTQPTHYAKKIMELQDLYSIEVLDTLIGIAIDEDAMDIKSFKKLLKEYNSNLRTIQIINKEEVTLTRDCSYYENIAKEMNDEYTTRR